MTQYELAEIVSEETEIYPELLIHDRHNPCISFQQLCGIILKLQKLQKNDKEEKK